MRPHQTRHGLLQDRKRPRQIARVLEPGGRLLMGDMSVGIAMPAEVREIVRIAGRAPSQGRWQVVLVEDADRMTEQASNQPFS